MHITMQMSYDWDTGRHDCHVTRRVDGEEPRIKSYRHVSPESVIRFFQASDGYWTAYSTKEAE